MRARPRSHSCCCVSARHSRPRHRRHPFNRPRSPCSTAPGSSSPAADAQGALELLRRLRASFPDSPLAMDADALSVECELALRDIYKARYFQQKLAAAAPGSRPAFSATAGGCAVLHGTRTSGWPPWNTTRRPRTCSRKAAAARGRTSTLPWCTQARSPPTRSTIRSRRAGTSRESPGSMLPPAEAALYRQLRVRLLWSVLTADSLGLKDSNVSCLRVDGDDLWVGTWNGGCFTVLGLVRHQRSVPRSAVHSFHRDRGQEDMDRDDRGSCMVRQGHGPMGSGPGTVHGSRLRASRWCAPRRAPSTPGPSVTVSCAWEAPAGRRSADGSLPGKFITCIAEDATRGRLLVGTMTVGLVILDLKTGAMSTLADSIPSFTSDNITTILPARDGRIWIGTYGEGLAVWSPSANTLRRYTRADAVDRRRLDPLQLRDRPRAVFRQLRGRGERAVKGGWLLEAHRDPRRAVVAGRAGHCLEAAERVLRNPRCGGIGVQRGRGWRPPIGSPGSTWGASSSCLSSSRSFSSSSCSSSTRSS